MDDLLSLRIALLLVIALGLLLGYDFSRKNKSGGIATAVALSVMGLSVLAYTYVSLPPTVIGAALLAGSIAVVAVVYLLSGKNPRVPLLLSFLPFMATSFFIVLITLYTVLVYASIVFAFVISFDYSGMSISSYWQKTRRFAKIFISPFYLIERAWRKEPLARGSRIPLMVSYIAFTMGVLLGVPFLVNSLARGAVSVDYLVVVLVIFVAAPALMRLHIGSSR